jgi:hypothetical protein
MAATRRRDAGCSARVRRVTRASFTARVLQKCALRRIQMLAWLRCRMRGHHRTGRYPLGGFRCRDCGAAGENLDEMGFEDGGYVAPMRRLYSRENSTFTRTSSWDTGRHLNR